MFHEHHYTCAGVMCIQILLVIVLFYTDHNLGHLACAHITDVMDLVNCYYSTYVHTPRHYLKIGNTAFYRQTSDSTYNGCIYIIMYVAEAS